MELSIPTAKAFIPLLQPARYKGLEGGRGGAKSHFVCGRLIEDCVYEHQRVACAREYQSSIKDSVKQLIEDKIVEFGLSPDFHITDREIVYRPTDSLFVFKGLDGKSADSFKSLEGFTRLFVEEAQTLSANSLEKTTPTMRTENAEMYFAWNPEKPSDPIDKYFKENAGDRDFIHVKVNYHDNPWFPEGLRRDMERDKRRDPDKYAHIWLGGYKRLSGARVFTNWRIEAFHTPSDARFFFGADWGFSNDPTVLIRCWLKGKTLYVDQEAYKIGCKIADTPALFEKIEGAKIWPIRADSARPETIEHMKDNGFPKMEAAQKGPNSVADGVEFLKSYDIVVHPRCRYTIDELSFYSYKIDKKTNEVMPVLSDKKNHVIDSLRYAVEGIRKSRVITITREAAHTFDMMTRRR